jgi:hypothetical protein
MGIDPSSDKCQAYYDKCRELGMVILSHCGEEKVFVCALVCYCFDEKLIFRL